MGTYISDVFALFNSFNIPGFPFTVWELLRALFLAYALLFVISFLFGLRRDGGGGGNG